MRATRPLIMVSITALLGASAFPPAANAIEKTLPGGTPISVEITTPANAAVLPPGPVTVTGKASVGTGAVPINTALTYVLDVSQSTLNAAGGCTGDENGDKISDTIMDCEIAAATALNVRARTLGTVGDVGAVAFGSTAKTAHVSPTNAAQLVTGPATDADGSGEPDIEQVLSSAVSTSTKGHLNVFPPEQEFDGLTNFEDAIAKMAEVVDASTKPNKIAVFLSDGIASEGPGNIANELTDSRLTGVAIFTFAIGSGSDCDRGNLAGNGRGSLRDIAREPGICSNVTTVADLPKVLPDLIRSQLIGLTLSVDGGPAVPITNVTPPLPRDGPATVDYTVVTPPLAAGAHRLCVTARGSDSRGEGTVTDCHTVTINAAPVVDAGGPYTGEEDTQVPIAGTVTDPDSTPAAAWSITPGEDVNPGATCTFADANALSTTVSCTEHGTYDLTLTVNDGLHPPVADTTTLTLINVPAKVSAGGPYTGQDNIPVPITGTVVDPDSPTLTTAWSITPAAGVRPEAVCAFGNAAQLSTVVTCTAEGTYTLTLTVDDGVNPLVTARTTLTLSLRPGALSLATVVDPAPGFVGGDPITVVHTVRNGGVSPMRSVRLVTTLPAAPQPETVAPAGCARVCDLGTLAPGQTVQVRLTFAVAAAVDLPVPATVTTTGPDTDPADNSTAVRIVIRQPVLIIDPGIGPQGFVTHATGRNFPPGARIQLRWSIGISETPGTVTVRPDGTLDAQALIFHKDTKGPRTLLAVPVTGPRFGDVASNPFLVVARTLKPKSFVIR